MSVRAWQPILSGPEAARARALIDASARELREHSEREGVEEPWIVLLFAYLAREGGGQAHARTAEQLLAELGVATPEEWRAGGAARCSVGWCA